MVTLVKKDFLKKGFFLPKLNGRERLNLLRVKQSISSLLFYCFFVYFFLMGISSLSAAYTYELSIASIFQNEARFMKEWIEFHKLMGVQHFYLYNNLSTDNYQAILQPYIDKGEVELIEWSMPSKNLKEWDPIQHAAFTNAINISRGKTKWLACLDLDEFLFPVQASSLVEFLKDYEEFAAVSVNWQYYGTSHVKQVPDNKLMIEMLLLKAPMKHWTNYMVKTIVQPQYTESCTSAHHSNYKPGYFQVNSDKIRFEGFKSPYIVLDKIRINHYWTKDEYHLTKVKAPRESKWWGITSQRILELNEELNKEKDDILLKFVPQLRRNMSVKIRHS